MGQPPIADDLEEIGDVDRAVAVEIADGWRLRSERDSGRDIESSDSELLLRRVAGIQRINIHGSVSDRIANVIPRIQVARPFWMLSPNERRRAGHKRHGHAGALPRAIPTAGTRAQNRKIDVRITLAIRQGVARRADEEVLVVVAEAR